jgi:hypothetical protein
MFENRAPRRIFESKMKHVTGKFVPVLNAMKAYEGVDV